MTIYADGELHSHIHNFRLKFECEIKMFGAQKKSNIPLNQINKRYLNQTYLTWLWRQSCRLLFVSKFKSTRSQSIDSLLFVFVGTTMQIDWHISKLLCWIRLQKHDSIHQLIYFIDGTLRLSCYIERILWMSETNNVYIYLSWKLAQCNRFF